MIPCAASSQSSLKALRQISRRRMQGAIEATCVAVELITDRGRSVAVDVGEREPGLRGNLKRELKRRHLC